MLLIISINLAFPRLPSQLSIVNITNYSGAVVAASALADDALRYSVWPGGLMKYTRHFNEIGLGDVALVGGKNASLGEMYRHLQPKGIPVPEGFAITAEAYRYFLQQSNLVQRIGECLHTLDTQDTDQLRATGSKIRRWIESATLPTDLEQDIQQSYNKLGDNIAVAVRSSATAEDLPTASFAGQQETYLNVVGVDGLLSACRKVFASLFTDRAISYRQDHGFAHEHVALSIGVQRMVRSDLAAAGVMFTLDTESGFRNVIMINAAYGLGETVVKGAVNPDEFHVFKPVLDDMPRAIISRHLGEKEQKLVYAGAGVDDLTASQQVNEEDRHRFCIGDDDVRILADYAVRIEEHYTRQYGRPMPMDIEWAKDGETGELFIVQARPETVRSQETGTRFDVYRLLESGKLLATGRRVGHKIACGRARQITGVDTMASLTTGEVLVTDMTDPDWEPVMKRASAIVTNRGGRTCHAAIVARELGIPAIVGCGDATESIADASTVTVCCIEGDNGQVYEGHLQFAVDRIDVDKTAIPKTSLMLNIGNPDQAFAESALPVSGVGLARLEFIINQMIGIHPRAVLDSASLEPSIQRHIDQRTTGYASAREYYEKKLAEGVATIAAAFYPRPVTVRFSDFKSNEYASLIGGAVFEPREDNPMLGLRGVSRYLNTEFRECFQMECKALKRVRDDMGFTNVELLLPFVRSVDEASKILDLLEANGLKRGLNGLRIHMMCEIPSNALLAGEFLQLFDGLSIGSNDLTQMTLGVDRDSGLLPGLDERDPAVLKLMAMAIEAAHEQGKYVGICGQAPSDYPEMVQWLVKQKIDAISLSADSVLQVLEAIRALEN